MGPYVAISAPTRSLYRTNSRHRALFIDTFPQIRIEPVESQAAQRLGMVKGCITRASTAASDIEFRSVMAKYSETEALLRNANVRLGIADGLEHLRHILV